LFLKALKPKKLKETIFYLGASFIKLAQVLATRSDFFSKEYLDELKELHDKLPKMSKSDFEDVFKESFKQECFKSLKMSQLLVLLLVKFILHIYKMIQKLQLN
jgi:predicted unusual protein kinase regulating ubiquinone biosynthesis (AarF/ABC1/UbiB family)